MAFGKLSNSRLIARNSVKYKKVVEPFGDAGTFAFESAKKKPKEHILNVVDTGILSIFKFMQTVTSAEKRELKGFDWIASQGTFDKALQITAIDGVNFYYKFFYLKHFTLRVLDKEAPPTFDRLSVGQDASKILRDLPIQKNGLKNVTITNDSPSDVMLKSTGIDTFMILNPSGTDVIQQTKDNLKNIKVNFFFMQKAKDSQIMFDDADSFTNLSVSTFASATIMMATMEAITNYDTSLDSIAGIAQSNKSTKSLGLILETKGRDSFISRQLSKKIRLELLLKPVLVKFLHRIASTIRPTWKVASLSPDVSMFQSELEDLLKKHYIKVARAFKNDASTEMVKSMPVGYEIKADALGLDNESTDSVDAMILMLIGARASTQSGIILKTIQKEINTAIQKTSSEAIKDGVTLSNREQGRLIEKDFEDRIKGKSEIIAMTETQTMAEEVKEAQANSLIILGAVVSGVSVALAMKKVWVTVIDEKTRDAHVRADGQVRDAGEPFIVGGEMLRVPSDTSLGASLGNVINCRCSARYTLNP